MYYFHESYYKFNIECYKFGGPPNCFSGFCETNAKCIDCPKALIDPEMLGKLEEETCARNGICKIGWRNIVTGGGNGYCECSAGLRGLSCNEN
jgi:hypothetical protein